MTTRLATWLPPPRGLTLSFWRDVRRRSRPPALSMPLVARCASRLGARRPTPLVEPGPVPGHLRALRRWRMPFAGRGLLTPVRRAPPQLDAIVEVVAHLERCGTVHHVLERERPGRAVAARI